MGSSNHQISLIGTGLSTRDDHDFLAAFDMVLELEFQVGQNPAEAVQVRIRRALRQVTSDSSRPPVGRRDRPFGPSSECTTHHRDWTDRGCGNRVLGLRGLASPTRLQFGKLDVRLPAFSQLQGDDIRGRLDRHILVVNPFREGHADHGHHQHEKHRCGQMLPHG